VVEVAPLTPAAVTILRGLADRFDEAQAARSRRLAVTNHDIKAVEYWINANSPSTELAQATEFVHLRAPARHQQPAYALMLKDARESVLVAALSRVLGALRQIAADTADLPMLARTHGQTASPTTLGKELRNVIARVERQFRQLEEQPLLGKINGAVGNYNAHLIAYPEVDFELARPSLNPGLS
jgi:adenylosuccinate lyase